MCSLSSTENNHKTKPGLNRKERKSMERTTRTKANYSHSLLVEYEEAVKAGKNVGGGQITVQVKECLGGILEYHWRALVTLSGHLLEMPNILQCTRQPHIAKNCTIAHTALDCPTKPLFRFKNICLFIYNLSI